MQYQRLKDLWESDGPKGTMHKLGRALATKDARPEDFSLRELAETFCGREWVKRLSDNRVRPGLDLYEAGEAVDVTAFSSITGQLVFSKILDGWKQADTGEDQLCETISSQLDGEKFPWLGNILGEGKDVAPGMPFPETGFGEQYIETPKTTKRGEIVSVTKETVFFDRTGQMLRQAGSIGERQRTGRAKQIYDVVLGVVNNHKYMGSSLNTYIANGTFWNNLKSGQALVDWTSINAIEQLFADTLDPVTGNPIDLGGGMSLLIPTALKHTARRIMSATNVRTVYPGYATQGASVTASVAAPGNVETDAPNTLDNYPVISTPYVKARLVAGGASASDAIQTWLVGNFKRAFAWIENWPISVVQAPPNATAEFERDIVARFRASYRGVAGVMDPRYVIKCTP